MIDHLIRDLQVLRKADFLIGKIWLTVLIRRAGLFAFAGLIGVFGLGMTNVAGYDALQQSIGAVWAAAAMAILDFAIAAIMLLVATKSGPGSEMDTALEVRRIAIDAIQENARDLKLTLNSLGEELKGVKENVARIMHNPLDVVSEKLLVPAALSMLRGLHSKKDDASENGPAVG